MYSVRMGKYWGGQANPPLSLSLSLSRINEGAISPPWCPYTSYFTDSIYMI